MNNLIIVEEQSPNKILMRNYITQGSLSINGSKEKVAFEITEPMNRLGLYVEIDKTFYKLDFEKFLRECIKLHIERRKNNENTI